MRPWKAFRKWRTFFPFSPFPAARFLRTFQSKAVFSEFSMPSEPPSTKNMWSACEAGIASVAKVSTKRAKCSV